MGPVGRVGVELSGRTSTASRGRPRTDWVPTRNRARSSRRRQLPPPPPRQWHHRLRHRTQGSGRPRRRPLVWLPAGRRRSAALNARSCAALEPSRQTWILETMKRLRTRHAPADDLASVGSSVLRSGLATNLLWIGTLKFKQYEVETIDSSSAPARCSRDCARSWGHEGSRESSGSRRSPWAL